MLFNLKYSPLLGIKIYKVVNMHEDPNVNESDIDNIMLYQEK